MREPTPLLAWPLQAVDLAGKIGKTAFNAGYASAVRAARAAAGNNGAADLVKACVEIGKLRCHAAIVRLHVAADHFDRLRHRNELVFQGMNGRAAVHRTDLRLDLVKPVSQSHQLVVTVGIKRIHPVFDAGPARFHAVHAVFAGKTIDHYTQLVELDLPAHRPATAKPGGQAG